MSGIVRYTLGSVATVFVVTSCLGPNPGWDEPGGDTSGVIPATDTAVMTATESGADTADPSMSTTSTPSSTSAGTQGASSGNNSDGDDTETPTDTADTTDSEDTQGEGSTGEANTSSGGALVTLRFGSRPDADVQTGGQDTFLESYRPAENFGAHVDAHFGTGSAALFSWDLESIPPGATVEEASVEFTMITEFTGLAEAYEVLERWAEGPFDEQNGVANWTNRTANETWTTEGVGVGSRGTDIVGTCEAAPWLDAQVLELDTDLVEKWVDDPSANHGVVMFNVDFFYGELATRNHPDPMSRPLLTITYREP